MSEKIKTKKFNAILFDLFGTLAYYTGKDELRRAVGKWHDVLLTPSLSNIKIPEEIKKKVRYYCSEDRMSIFLYPDSLDVLNRLKEKGYKLALVSNVYDIIAIRMRSEFGDFISLFDFAAFSCEMGVKKPDLEIFRRTLNYLKVEPSKACMIGDREDRDIIPARSLDMEARLIDREKQNLYRVLEDLI